MTSVPERMCNTDVIFRPGHYVRQKESQMPVYPGALSPPAPPKQEVELCESSGRAVVRKGEESFWNSHALHSHGCFPGVISTDYH